MRSLSRRPSSLLFALAGLAIACRSDEFEPPAPLMCETPDSFDAAGNSSRQGAAAIEPSFFDANGEWSTPDLFLCAGDEDWFSLDASAGQQLFVELNFQHDLSDLQLQLVNPDGVTIATAGSASDGESLRFTFVTDGVYTLRVYGATPAVSGLYGMQVTLLGDVCAPDAFEPNGAATSAPSLPTGLTQDLTVCFGELDYYKIEAGDGQLVQARAAFDVTQADLSLLLYRINPDGTLAGLVSSTLTDSGAALAHQVVGDAEHVLRVTRGTRTLNGFYDLDLTIGGEPCEPDADEPNNGYLEPKLLTGNASLTDRTICMGDTDWYSLNVPNGRLLAVDAFFDHRQVDIGLTVYEVMGDGTITARVSANTVTDDESIRYFPLTTGTFLINVAATRGTVVGSYDLDVRLEGDACTPDAYEPNNGYFEAAALTPGAYTNMTLCVGDDDWYHFNVDPGQLITARADFDPARADLGLQLYQRNTDGTITSRASADTVGSFENVLYRTFEGDEHLLRVYRSRGTQLATYGLTLAVDGEACVDDPGEPNDNYLAPTAITPGLQTGRTLCVADTDWYSFNAANGQTITLDAIFDHEENDIGLRLARLNPDGTLSTRATADTITDDEHILYQPYDTGTFLVNVYRTRGAALGRYDLNFQLSGTPCLDDEDEPNNGASEASPLGDGALSDRTLCVGDTDWYSFSAANGQLITNAIRFSHAQNDLGLQLYQLQADGTLVSRASSNGLTDDEVILYRPIESGDFVANVFRTRGTLTATYDIELAVTGSACGDDPFEPNNTYPEAAPISRGRHDDITLCVGDDDWYKLDLINGQTFRGTAYFSHAENDLAVSINRLNDDGTLTGRASSDSLTDNEYLIYTPYDTGTFLYRVFRSRGAVVANYDVEIAVDGAGCVADTYEPNNHWLQAKPLAIGATVSNLSSCVGDDDYFAVAAQTAGKQVQTNVLFSHANGNLNTALYALNADNTITTLASASSLTDNEAFNYVMTTTHAGKPLIFRVFRSTSPVAGPYSVRIDVP